VNKGIVEITPSGFETLELLTRYMAEFIGATEAEKLSESLILKAVEVLQERPESCPVCFELELLGVLDYRQLTVDKYKILYRFSPASSTSFITAFMRQKQSAEELLIQSVLRMGFD